MMGPQAVSSTLDLYPHNNYAYIHIKTEEFYSRRVKVRVKYLGVGSFNSLSLLQLYNNKATPLPRTVH